MGLLAILDTFLLFKIAERRYNTTIGLIASVLFAVMPLTWIIRRIWLEPVQLPFILASILLALYITNSNLTEKRKSIHIVLLSGALLGLAIFTKIPVVSLIPLVGFIIYSNSKNFKLIGLWIIPVLLIPLLWPMYAISQGELNEWITSMY
jgi:4-amino-4-deoxy-L-arabinose transferase-like glycosyltransferase